MRRLRQLNSFGRMGIHGQPWGWTPAQGLGGDIPIPMQIADLLLWLDAAAIPGLADTDPVVTWPDRSGNGNDALTVSTSPTYRTGILNGKPVVRFDGIGDSLATVASLFSGANPRTIVAVNQHADPGAGVYGVVGPGGDGGAPGPFNSWFMIQVRNVPVGDPYFAQYGAGDLTGPAVAVNEWHIHTMSYDGASGFLYKDQVQVNTGAIPALNTDPAFVFRIGHSNDVGLADFLSGDLAEVFCYGHWLDATERALLWGYLIAKWNL